MLAIVTPASLEAVLATCERWEVRASVVGVVTDGGSLRILDRRGGEVLADVPASSLHDAAPLYRRPLAEPDRSAEVDAATLDAPADWAADLLGLLGDPAWVWEQYDHQLFLNTVVGPGGDASVLRLKHPTTGRDTGRGLALTTDGNHRWCAVSPRRGTARLVVESTLNLACAGARPVALVNCLNFGNPEHATVMWQLSEAIDGMADACRALDIPVVGGNVSLYNESAGRDIDPTPVVGLLGLVDELRRIPPGAAMVDGAEVVLLGDAGTAADLPGSRWAWERGAHGGELAPADLAAVGRLAGLVRALVADDLLAGVHDVAEGGLATCVAEMAARAGVGAQLEVAAEPGALFGEPPASVVACVAPDRLPEVEARAASAGVALTRLGRAGGDVLRLGPLSVPVAAVAAAWRGRLPEAFATVPASS
jgi:phosphoribosylformylglycinamidine synthase